jgi:hypothetical protein
MPYQTITFSTANSTVPGNSTPAALNWIGGKPTTVSLSFGGSSTVANDATIQYTLDDIQRVASTSVVWQYITSSLGIGTNSTSIFHFASTSQFDAGFLVQFLSPIAAVRLGSSALSSTGGLGTISLRVLQGEAW